MCFRAKVRGLDNLPAVSEPGVIVCNHVSCIDALVLLALLPDELHFVIRGSAGRLLPRLASVSAVESDAQLRDVIRSLKDTRKRIVVFAEAVPSSSGRIAKVDALAATLADRLAGSCYIPVAISGTEIGLFAGNRWQIGRWLPQITIGIGKPCRHLPPAKLKGEKKRLWQEMLLRRLLEEALFASCDLDLALPDLLVASARRFGAGCCVVSEVGPPARRLSYRTLLRACFALGGKLGQQHPAGERIGVLLPTSVGAVAVFHAVQFAGLVPAMLNFSASSKDVLAACRTAGLKTVYTSQRFLDRHDASKKHVAELAKQDIKVVLLEDVRASLAVSDKLRALVHSLMPAASLQSGDHYRIGRPDDPAVVLFTSGSEGDPKGVVLSHRNLVANANQVIVRLAAGPGDVLFNALPMFHSTGLLSGAVLPMVGAFEAVEYPSPLHHSNIPALLLATQATMLLSTSTFLGQYARSAHPNDMQTLRQVYAGGEKLRPAVSQLWLDKFGTRIHEGYGVTETSPVLAVDSPWTWMPGSVGALLPGIEAELVAVPGIEVGGRLRVRGANIMLGLLTGGDDLQPPEDGWHDTGDIATIDEFGFVRIVGRARRFAKIAGEMVPLARIEEIIDELFVDCDFAVVAVADAERGERLVLVSNNPDVQIEQVRECIDKAAASKLWVPKQLLAVKEFPLLGSGKPNLPEVARLAAAGDGSRRGKGKAAAT